MFVLNDRVKHIESGMIGTVLAVRVDMILHREEVRVLFDEHDKVSAWAPARDYEGA
jgi:hypothetical protein